VFYGICLLLVITTLPDGVWPWVAKRIGLGSRNK
jgi:branched-chain amino acid transport system permease protein